MIQDSGERRVFDTGAQRDRQTGKGRMDLLPYRALIEISKLFEQGAIKYESRNWEKGMPVKEFLDSGARHHAKCMIGELDEPHLVQWCWNALCALDTYLRIKEGTLSGELMDDLPFTEFRLMGDCGQRSTDRGPLTDVRTTPKIGDIYNVFHRLERIVDVTSDHVSTGVAVYTSDEWNKFYRLGYINFHGTEDQRTVDPGPEVKGPEDQRTVDPGPEVKGPEVKGPLTFEFKHTDQCAKLKDIIKQCVPVTGQIYLIFYTPWKVVNLEWTQIVLQSVTSGNSSTVSWDYWNKRVASGDIYLAGEQNETS